MRVLICTTAAKSPPASCGSRCNTRKIIRYLKKWLRENRPQLTDGDIEVKKTKCLMRCDEGPVLLFHHPAKTWYRYDGESDIDELVSEHLLHGRVVERLLLADSRRTQRVQAEGRFA